MSELPKTVSAAPIYKQMERLQEIKESHESELQALKTTGKTSLDCVVDLNKFEDFSSHYRKFVNEEIPPNDLRQIIKKFIHKVEVGTETVKIHWIVDKEHYDRELALKGAGSSGSSLKGANLFLFENRTRNVGSQSLTFGARVEQVGEHLTILIFECESCPEPKILSGAELRTMYGVLNSWYLVAETIGASEAFVRQNGRK